MDFEASPRYDRVGYTLDLRIDNLSSGWLTGNLLRPVRQAYLSGKPATLHLRVECDGEVVELGGVRFVFSELEYLSRSNSDFGAYVRGLGLRPG